MKLLILLAVVLVSCEKARFDNYRVYEILIENEDQLSLLKSIEEYPDGYRFLEFSKQVGKNAQLIVPPHKFGEFGDLVDNFQIKSRLKIKNLQEVIDNEQPKKDRKVLDWTSYWTYDEVNTWMESLIEMYPGVVTPIVVGKSFEDREIRGIKVNIGGEEKKSVVFEGTIHAREWISTATTTWMINELLTSNDAEVQEIAKAYEWIVLPITNPDGYVYTWTKDRIWRKTRKPSNLLCFGADPNRNWDNHFNEAGSSSNPCSDLYAGSAAFSEQETRALSEYIKTIPRLAVYFAFHAYGQMMMLPYGWTTQLLDNYEELYEIGAKGVEALTSKYSTEYKLGSIANVIYLSSGSSLDWVKAELRTNVTYAYEFRDEGRYGFSLPSTEIIPNSIEVFASIVAILKEAQARGIA